MTRHAAAPSSRRLGRRRPSPRRGFTLLELILALAITCVLALSLYSSLRTAFVARDSAAAAIESVRTRQVAFDLLGRDLGSALPTRGLDSMKLSAEFYGNPPGSGSELDASLTFYTMARGDDDARALADGTPADPTRADGVRRVEWGLMTQPDGTRALVRRVWTNLLSTFVTDPEEEVVCADVDSLVFEYSDGQYTDTTWDSAAEGELLPAAVRVTMAFRRPGDTDEPIEVSRTFVLPCGTSQLEATQ